MARMVPLTPYIQCTVGLKHLSATLAQRKLTADKIDLPKFERVSLVVAYLTSCIAYLGESVYNKKSIESGVYKQITDAVHGYVVENCSVDTLSSALLSAENTLKSITLTNGPTSTTSLSRIQVLILSLLCSTVIAVELFALWSIVHVYCYH